MVFGGVCKTFQGLGGTDLLRQAIQGGLHQGIHGFYGFADVHQPDGFDFVRADGHGHIDSAAAQHDGGGVDARHIDCGSCGRVRRTILRGKHIDQKKDEKDAKGHEDSRIDQFFHAEDDDFGF